MHDCALPFPKHKYLEQVGLPSNGLVMAAEDVLGEFKRLKQLWPTGCIAPTMTVPLTGIYSIHFAPRSFPTLPFKKKLFRTCRLLVEWALKLESFQEQKRTSSDGRHVWLGRRKDSSWNCSGRRKVRISPMWGLSVLFNAVCCLLPLVLLIIPFPRPQHPFQQYQSPALFPSISYYQVVFSQILLRNIIFSHHNSKRIIKSHIFFSNSSLIKLTHGSTAPSTYALGSH